MIINVLDHVHTHSDRHTSDFGMSVARFLRCWKRTFASQTFVVPGRRCNRIIEWFRIMRPTGTENVDFSKKTEKKQKQNQKQIHQTNKLTGRMTRKTKTIEKQINIKTKITQNLDFPLFLNFVPLFFLAVWFVFFLFAMFFFF